MIMRRTLTRFALALLATTAVGTASAQVGSYPCTGAENLPNPYRLVTGWAQTPRPWQPVNALTVDGNNNLWVVDRCEEDSCKPVLMLTADGKTMKNFGEERQGHAGDQAFPRRKDSSETRQGRPRCGPKGLGHFRRADRRGDGAQRRRLHQRRPRRSG